MKKIYLLALILPITLLFFVGMGSFMDAAAAQIPAPLVITARQSRVMLGVIVVALVIAFVIVATWWARR